jgi:heat-inducible transcriptional repressor
MMGHALHSKRNREILAEIVRAYVAAGEPVSSKAIALSHLEGLSSATVRKIMGELEDDGLLYQPHTSAGRVPTALAYRHFAQQAVAQGKLSEEDRNWISSELDAAATPEEMTERAGHVLSAISRGLGIIVMPALAQSALEHIRFVQLPDGRVVVVLISSGGAARDKVVRTENEFTQAQLDDTAGYINARYVGWTLEAIRADLLQKLASERERYERLVPPALELCDPAILESTDGRQVYVEGAAQIISAPELATGEGEPLRELLMAIEEKSKLVALLDRCIETPEPVQIQIGVKEIAVAGEHLALITARYAVNEQAKGSLGVLGLTRMEYERAITAVAFMARSFSEALSRENPNRS